METASGGTPRCIGAVTPAEPTAIEYHRVTAGKMDHVLPAQLAREIGGLSLAPAADIATKINATRKQLEEGRAEADQWKVVALDSQRTSQERQQAMTIYQMFLSTIGRLQAELNSYEGEQAALKQPPPATAAAFDVASDARKTAEQIWADMLLSNDLDAQRAQSSFGEHLRTALPVSTLDARSHLSQFILADEFLPYIGSCSAFLEALQTEGTGAQHRPPVVAVLQASGSGKTRLAYEAGMRGWFVVLVRLWKQTSSQPTPAWKYFLDRSTMGRCTFHADIK